MPADILTDSPATSAPASSSGGTLPLGALLFAHAKTARDIGELISLAGIYHEDGAHHTAHGRMQGAREAMQDLVLALARDEEALRRLASRPETRA